MEEVYTCDCGNQGWFITGEKIICTKCRSYHLVIRGTLNSASEFNRLKTTFKVMEETIKELESK